MIVNDKIFIFIVVYLYTRSIGDEVKVHLPYSYPLLPSYMINNITERTCMDELRITLQHNCVEGSCTLSGKFVQRLAWRKRRDPNNIVDNNSLKWFVGRSGMISRSIP